MPLNKEYRKPNIRNIEIGDDLALPISCKNGTSPIIKKHKKTILKVWKALDIP
jgi:hypothetical protein